MRWPPRRHRLLLKLLALACCFASSWSSSSASASSSATAAPLPPPGASAAAALAYGHGSRGPPPMLLLRRRIPRITSPWRLRRFLQLHMSFVAASSLSTPAALLRQRLLEGLRQRLLPVQHIDMDARRYAEERGAFHAYMLGRFALPSLEAQMEESEVRRVVHEHLLTTDAEYRGWIEETLPSLADPWAAATNDTDLVLFRPTAALLTSASKRHAYLANARKAGLAKKMEELKRGVEVARRRVADREGSAAEEALTRREGLLQEWAAKQARFDALIPVLTNVEGRLMEARAKVLSRLALGGQVTTGGDDSSAGGVVPGLSRDTSAWGKAAERQAQTALEAVVAEVNEHERSSGQPPLRVLSSVVFKTLDREEMVALREAALAEGREAVYGTDVERCKGEIDLLIVRPTPEDEHVLQVILAVEVKRSLDQVAANCVKLHLLLDVCRRADREAFRYPSSAKAEGFILDFSTVEAPAGAAVYIAQRGGRTLRAVSRMMFEAVQLLRATRPRPASPSSKDGDSEEQDVEDEEAELLLRQRILAFYAPDFVDPDTGSAAEVAAAVAAREAVVDELWDRFRTKALAKVEARLGRVRRALMGEGDEGATSSLETVFLLGKGRSSSK